MRNQFDIDCDYQDARDEDRREEARRLDVCEECHRRDPLDCPDCHGSRKSGRPSDDAVALAEWILDIWAGPIDVEAPRA